MAFTFPSSPTLNQLYQPVGGPTYKWNGFAWEMVVGYVNGGGGGGATVFAGCRVSRTTAQSIPTATDTSMQWDVEEFDTGGFVTLGTNNTRINVLVNGFYNFTGSVDFITNTTGLRRLSFLDNNAKRYAPHQQPANSTGPVAELTVTTGPVYLLAGAWMVLQCQQQTGANLNANSALLSAFSMQVLY